MKFTERYPNYIDVGMPRQYDVYSLDDLYAVPRVKDAMTWPDFYRLSLDTEESLITGSKFLMAETKEGYAWWAIGRFNGAIEEWVKALPTWKPKYE
jgi:hypothetical protein